MRLIVRLVGVEVGLILSVLLLASALVVVGASGSVIRDVLYAVALVCCIGAWTQLTLLIIAWRRRSSEATEERLREGLLAAAGAGCVAAISIGLLIGRPLPRPWSSVAIVLAVLLLLSPSVLFSWRYWPCRND